MKQADDYLVFCPKNIGNMLEKYGFLHLADREDVSILRVTAEGLRRIQYPYQLIMDKYVLIEVGENASNIASKLFDYIANYYDSIVNISRNKENIRVLLGAVMDFAVNRSGAVILDYGSGTGLSAELAAEYGITIVGCDSSKEMRRIARNRGMDVGTLTGIEARRCEYDGVIASYALHFVVDVGELERIWRLLKNGAVFAANFHKDKNYEFVRDCMTRLGATIVPVKVTDLKYKHGLIVAFVK